tara:strand:+ start:1004 stop:1591 length:588 start_codon:yes stop_codon:yes gene_type:complete
MSGAYPTTPEFSAVNVESKHANLVSETRSGRRQVRSIGSQRWSFTAQYSPMTRAIFSPVYAFVISQQGQLGTFTIVPPVISNAQGNVSGSVLGANASAIGDATVDVDAMTGTLKAGDFIKFAGHSKVYMVTADVTAAGGDATLSIEPPLMTAVSDGEAVIYDSVVFTMRLNNDIQSYALGGYEKYNYEIDMIEVL